MVKEMEKPEFKPVKLCFKNGLVSHPAHVEGCVNTYINCIFNLV